MTRTDGLRLLLAFLGGCLIAAAVPGFWHGVMLLAGVCLVVWVATAREVTR